MVTCGRYDQEYVEHFTGVRPMYLPTLAEYVNARYAPEPQQPILFARAHHKARHVIIRHVIIRHVIIRHVIIRPHDTSRDRTSAHHKAASTS